MKKKEKKMVGLWNLSLFNMVTATLAGAISATLYASVVLTVLYLLYSWHNGCPKANFHSQSM